MVNIIFIDDDDDFREAITSILTNAGYKVVALKGSETLDKTLQESKFDLAIVDYFLPMENGIEIIKRIASSEAGKNLKILMISSHENILPLIRQNGIKNFMPKPMDPEDLIRKIDAMA